MEETSKKFIENRIKEILTEEMVRVLKRNPGHIALCEVETMPPPELIKGISKYCHEKIEFTLRDEKEAPWEAYCKWEREELKKIHRRRKRKAKKRRKRILKAISGLCPEPHKRADA